MAAAPYRTKGGAGAEVTTPVQMSAAPPTIGITQTTAMPLPAGGSALAAMLPSSMVEAAAAAAADTRSSAYTSAQEQAAIQQNGAGSAAALAAGQGLSLISPRTPQATAHLLVGTPSVYGPNSASGAQTTTAGTMQLPGAAAGASGRQSPTLGLGTHNTANTTALRRGAAAAPPAVPSLAMATLGNGSGVYTANTYGAGLTPSVSGVSSTGPGSVSGAAVTQVTSTAPGASGPYAAVVGLQSHPSGAPAHPPHHLLISTSNAGVGTISTTVTPHSSAPPPQQQPQHHLSAAANHSAAFGTPMYPGASAVSAAPMSTTHAMAAQGNLAAMLGMGVPAPPAAAAAVAPSAAHHLPHLSTEGSAAMTSFTLDSTSHSAMMRTRTAAGPISPNSAVVMSPSARAAALGHSGLAATTSAASPGGTITALSARAAGQPLPPVQPPSKETTPYRRARHLRQAHNMTSHSGVSVSEKDRDPDPASGALSNRDNMLLGEIDAHGGIAALLGVGAGGDGAQSPEEAYVATSPLNPRTLQAATTVAVSPNAGVATLAAAPNGGQREHSSANDKNGGVVDPADGSVWNGAAGGYVMRGGDVVNLNPNASRNGADSKSSMGAPIGPATGPMHLASPVDRSANPSPVPSLLPGVVTGRSFNAKATTNNGFGPASGTITPPIKSSDGGGAGRARMGASRPGSAATAAAARANAATSAKPLSVYDEWNNKMKIFRYILQLAGLNQHTSRVYRTYLRFILWSCVLLCGFNMGFRTRSYRNPLFDFGLVFAHVWLAVSYEVWYAYLHSAHWTSLVNIVTKHRGSGFLRIVQLIGYVGVVFVLGGCLIIYTGWITPIWMSMLDQFRAGSSEHEQYFPFLVAHGVIMTILILPWVAVCFCAWTLFFLSVSAHKSDIAVYEKFISVLFTQTLGGALVSLPGGGVAPAQALMVPGNAGAQSGGKGDGTNGGPSTQGAPMSGQSSVVQIMSSMNSDAVWAMVIAKHKPLRDRLTYTCEYFAALYSSFLTMCFVILVASVYDFHALIFISGNGVTFSVYHLAQDVLLLGLGIVGLYCGLWSTASLTTTWRAVLRRLNELPARAGFQLTKHNLPLHASLMQYLTLTEHAYQVYGFTVDYNLAIGIFKLLFEVIVIMLFAVNLQAMVTCH